MSDVDPRAALPAETSMSPPLTDRSLPEDFRPLCLDCRYDLTGLADGKCPECGVKFTHATLVRVFLARQAAREGRMQSIVLRLPALLVYLSPLIGMVVGDWCVPYWQSDSYRRWELSVIIALPIHAVSMVAWFVVFRKVWIARSERVLWFLLPVLILMLMILEVPGGRVYCAVMGAYCAVISWQALRWSPLLAGGILAGGGALPLAGFGVVMWIDAGAQISLNHHWSSFDYPSAHGWRAMSAVQSRESAVGVFACGLLLAVVISLYARRAMVRLKHRQP